MSEASLTRRIARRAGAAPCRALSLPLERKDAAALRSTQAEARRRAARDREAEGRRIARDLHDTLGQSLVLLQLGLDALGRDLPERGAWGERVARLQSLAAELGRDMDRIAAEIHPLGLEEFGFAAAIRMLLDRWSEHSGLQVEQQIEATPDLPEAVAASLYRVLQEALTNVARHARARRVCVVVAVVGARAGRSVSLVVEDDGFGFAAATGAPHRRRGGLGLGFMRERLASVGGTLEIESAPGGGTTLFARIPL